MNVTFANLDDVKNIESLAYKSFYKMNLDKTGLSYDRDDFKLNIKKYIQDSNYIAVKCEEHNKFLGVALAVASSQIYTNKKTIVHIFAFQALPNLSSYKQSKVIIKLLKYIERLCMDCGANSLAVSFTHKYDFSKYLKKNKYKESDLIFLRRF